MSCHLKAVCGRARATAAATALPFLLAACGGGDDNAASAQVYNLDATITQALAAPFQVDGLTARDAQGNAFTLSLRHAPGADAMFESAATPAPL